MTNPLNAPAVDVYLCSFDANDIVRVSAGIRAVTTVARGVAGSGLAVDRAGNLYRGHWATDPGVLKLPADGGAPTLLASGFHAMSVAADWAGNVYATGSDSAAGNQTLKLPATGGAPEVIAAGKDLGWAVAADGMSTVYVLHHHPVMVTRIPAGGPISVIDLSGTFRAEFVAAFTVDPQGQNLFLSDWSGPSDTVLKVPLNGGPRTRLGAGLAGVQGVAVDVDGNVYIADTFHERVVMVTAGQQITVCEVATPLPLAIPPTHLHSWRGPDLVGRLFGAAAVDGGGWLVVGDHFIPIPPRSPVLSEMLRAAASHLGSAMENPELGHQLRELRSR
jgi:DNA-binding beta-propeller fold protein YncE